MRILIVVCAIVALPTMASAQYYGNQRSSGYGYGYGSGSNTQNHYVRPHVRSDGDFVGGHYRTNPNNTLRDNYGTSGNYNPYTGQTGRRNSNGW